VSRISRVRVRKPTKIPVQTRPPFYIPPENDILANTRTTTTDYSPTLKVSTEAPKIFSDMNSIESDVNLNNNRRRAHWRRLRTSTTQMETTPTTPPPPTTVAVRPISKTPTTTETISTVSNRRRRPYSQVDYWRTSTTPEPRIPYARLSFAEQLALSHRREAEARRKKEEKEELDKQGKYKESSHDDVEGSGTSIEDRMIGDEAKVIVPRIKNTKRHVVNSIVEVADMDLASDVNSMEAELWGHDAILIGVDKDGNEMDEGELVDEHIIKVHDPKIRRKHRS